MRPADLELYTTQELIDELMRRKTFLGIVIHSEEELRSRAWTGERVFKVNFNSNLDVDQARGLLDVIAQYMEQQSE